MVRELHNRNARAAISHNGMVRHATWHSHSRDVADDPSYAGGGGLMVVVLVVVVVVMVMVVMVVVAHVHGQRPAATCWRRVRCSVGCVGREGAGGSDTQALVRLGREANQPTARFSAASHAHADHNSSSTMDGSSYNSNCWM